LLREEHHAVEGTTNLWCGFSALIRANLCGSGPVLESRLLVSFRTYLVKVCSLFKTNLVKGMMLSPGM
jgi:hypothetical protein